MPRVLAFRHVPFEGLGRIEPVLRAHAYDIDYADLYLPFYEKAVSVKHKIFCRYTSSVSLPTNGRPGRFCVG